MTVYPVGQGAWWSATGDQMSQDWCYLTFLFMIQLRELGTQSWNMQMLSNSEALQIQGNKREMRPMGRQREYEFPLGRPLRRNTNETLKRWSWRECPGGFFTQEDFFFFFFWPSTQSLLDQRLNTEIQAIRSTRGLVPASHIQKVSRQTS